MKIMCNLLSRENETPSVYAANGNRKSNGTYGLDLCGLFPESYDGKVYILTCTDHFSKWTESIPISYYSSKSAGRQYILKIRMPIGISIRSRFRILIKKLIKTLCEKFHITKIMTTPYHPNSNGVAERVHRTLNSIMGRVVSEQ